MRPSSGDFGAGLRGNTLSMKAARPGSLHLGSIRPWRGRSRHAGCAPGGSIWPNTSRLIDHARLLHFGPARSPPRTFADSGKPEAAVLGRDVLISSITITVFPTPAPQNRPTLPPFRNGRKVNRNAGFGDFGLIDCSAKEARTMDGIGFFRNDVFPAVNRRACDAEHAAERFAPDRNGNRRARVRNFNAALQAVGRRHGDRAHFSAAHVLRHFES